MIPLLAAVLCLAFGASASALPQVVPQRQVQTFRYDDLGRLTRATYDGATTISWERDAAGNVTSTSVTPHPPKSGSGGSSSRCFIATAAYGSPLAPEVQALRDFRDQQLRSSAPGRAFIAWYERTSPPLADWIAQRPFARALSRGLLAPLLLTVGHPRTAAVVVPLLLALCVLGGRTLRRRLGRHSSSGEFSKVAPEDGSSCGSSSSAT